MIKGLEESIPKWEYQYHSQSTSPVPLETLNEYGEQGWELLAYQGSAGSYLYSFKRRK